MMHVVRIAVGVSLATVAGPALAHTGVAATQGFLAGLTHPLLGLDHLLAMIAVGLWAGIAGGRALWAWPAAFVAVLVIGALIGHHAPALSGVEIGIAFSVLALGSLVALKATPRLAAGAAICAAFALFHGHAHGAELPAGAGIGAYAAGFVLATALLHVIGAVLGLGLARDRTIWLRPLAGGAIGSAGLSFLLG